MVEKKSEIFTNRELSWLQFNERVLEEAENETNPTFERFNFLSIFINNLDEFYRVRVGMLSDQLLLDEDWRDPQTKTIVSDQFSMVLRRTKRLIPRFNEAYKKVMKDLKTVGLSQITEGDKLLEKDEDYLKNFFKYQVAPLIMPFIVEKSHPLPFFENDRLVIGVTLRTKKGNNRFGFLTIPEEINKIVRIPSDPHRYILIEDLVRRYVDRIFHKFIVEGKIVFSVVRNADIDESDGLYDYDPDFSETMSKIIEVRNFRAPVLLKYQGNTTPKMINYLAKNLALRKTQTFEYETPLQFDFLPEVEKMLGKRAKRLSFYPTHIPAKNSSLDESTDLIAQLLKKDALMSYPFESISTMVTLIKQAAKDERVSEISMTLYRASKKSKIVAGLVEASKQGKKVTCVVELRARFDEENNIDLSEKLQSAGVNVVYGIPGYKVHSKLLLIELKDGQKISLIGTGNFNESTAKFYTDVALMTSHQEIASDVKQIFEHIETDSFVQQTQQLLVSPITMKPKLLELIEEEIERAKAGEPARIIMKMNSLTEKEMMEKLVKASKVGVQIDLIVRGICCLIAGIPNETENIRVRSIVGRYLEHSRIFAFGAGGERPRKYYISSADLMTRNLTERVEAASPILDEACQKKLQQILDYCLADNVNARVQKPSGKYTIPKVNKKISRVDSQECLSETARDSSVKIQLKKEKKGK